MSTNTQREMADNFVGAFAHLMTGDANRRTQFLSVVNIILHRRAANIETLMQFSAQAKAQERPFIWIAPHHHGKMMHALGVIICDGERTIMVESCFPWLSEDGKEVWLLSDRVDAGAFKFDSELKLQFFAKAPVKDFDAAIPGIGRAYNRLIEIEIQQMETEGGFKVPSAISSE